MKLILLLDFAWKFLFFVTIFSTFYFVAVAFLPKFFKLLSASKKMTSIKWSKASLISSFALITLYLTFTDQELVVDCFGHFASKEGVFGVTRMISSIWLAGFTLFLIKDIVSYILVIRKLNRYVLSEQIYSIGPKRVSYFEVEALTEPVVAGFFLPKIYIPQPVSADAQSLKHILSHEYVHLKNKDGLWNFIALVIHRLNWPNPLSYLAINAMKTSLEMATDEQAVEEFSLDVAAYAKSLVDLVSQNARQSNLVMNVSGSFLQIQERLLNLKNVQSGLVESKSIYAWLLFVVLGVGFTQAFASIRQETQSPYETPMCFQVKHELMIEGWITAPKAETNKCE